MPNSALAGRRPRRRRHAWRGRRGEADCRGAHAPRAAAQLPTDIAARAARAAARSTRHARDITRQATRRKQTSAPRQPRDGPSEAPADAVGRWSVVYADAGIRRLLRYGQNSASSSYTGRVARRESLARDAQSLRPVVEHAAVAAPEKRSRTDGPAREITRSKPTLPGLIAPRTPTVPTARRGFDRETRGVDDGWLFAASRAPTRWPLRRTRGKSAVVGLTNARSLTGS